MDFRWVSVIATYQTRCFMKLIRPLIIASIAFIAISWFSHSAVWKRTNAFILPKKEKNFSRAPLTTNKLEQKGAAAKLFVQRKDFNQQVCFLIDMTLPPGHNRFFIYDLKKDSVLSAGLVAHGNCFEYWLPGRRYSNVVGSGCTSLGKYKIGNSYTGKFGYSYKLHGLDSTNNNAFERTVVLHSHSCVSETETSDDICQSNGCPTVSPGFLIQLKKIINNSKKPVLLWIYE
jgi:L,D-transpeptidase catalytic domain